MTQESSRTNQNMTVPNAAEKEKKESNYLTCRREVQNQMRLFVRRQEIINAFQVELIWAADDSTARLH